VGQNKFQNKVGGFFCGKRFFSAVVDGRKCVGLLRFLKGVVGKSRVSMWFFGGENVVRCMVDVEF
jgi:hypothetical protein